MIVFDCAADAPKLALCQRVQKREGYRFPGIVVGLFWTQAGALRYVVEADNSDFEGMLHIFNQAQLEPRT